MVSNRSLRLGLFNFGGSTLSDIWHHRYFSFYVGGHRLEREFLTAVCILDQPFENMYEVQMVNGRTGPRTLYFWLLTWLWLVAKVRVDDFR